MKVGSTTLDRSMPGRTCFSRVQIRDLFSSDTVSVWAASPAWRRGHTHKVREVIFPARTLHYYRRHVRMHSENSHVLAQA